MQKRVHIVGDNIRGGLCVMHAAMCTHLTIPVHRSLMNHKESSGKS